MQIDLRPFYAFSPEDRLIKRSNKIGLVTQEGRATSALKERYEKYSFKLNPECRREILLILSEKFQLKGRAFLHIETSIQEISQKIRKVAKKRFNVKLKSLFIGGGLLKPLKSLFIDFFSHFGMKDPIGALFKLKLDAAPNDYDFQFIAPLEKLQNYKVLVDEGIVYPLASKMNGKLIDLKLLTETLWTSQKHAKTLPNDSYLCRIFEEHPNFDSNSQELSVIAVKALGFKNAFDSPNKESESGFYYRNIASSKKSYDCFFPKGLPSINSLCIDITQCENDETDLYLESLQGKEMVIQAIIDANFAILYTDQKHRANELDLARIFCLISQKKRWFGNKSLLKAFNAFEEERLKRKLSLSEMLPQQIISRAKNHHRSHQAAEVITFNACAILMWLKPDLEDEIQKIWQEICKHIIKVKKSILYSIKDPLIEQIYVLMRDSKCSFRDLLSQIQVSSFLLQHACKEGMGKYKCRPTQSEDQLYTQIVINFSQNDLEDDNLDCCTLFFPFTLSESIVHIQKLDMEKNCSLNSLKSIHELLFSVYDLTVGVNKSVLHKDKYCFDPRRHYDQSVLVTEELFSSKNQYTWKIGFQLFQAHLAMNNNGNRLNVMLTNAISMLLDTWPTDEYKDEISHLLQKMLNNSDGNIRIEGALHLLSIKDQGIWKMGFQLFQSHFAMKNDEMILEKLLTRVIFMLVDDWPTEEYKSEISQLLRELLRNLGINIRANFFQRPTLNSLIGDLLSSDEKLINDLGRKYFKDFEDRPHDELEQLYFDLINFYFLSENINKIENPFLEKLLKKLGKSKLKLESTLKIFITLVNKNERLKGVENELLGAIWKCFHKITTLDGKVHDDVQKLLPKFVLIVLQSNACKLSPHIGLCLADKVHRLKIFDKKSADIKNSFEEAVITIHSLTVSATDIDPIYSHHQFDAMSDFMQTYSLQSLHSLKASILRRLKTISSQYINLKHKEILKLLSLLIQSQAAWNERFFIVDTLNNLPATKQQLETGQLFELFSSNISSSTNRDQIEFYLDQLNKTETYGHYILQLLLDLLCKEITLSDDIQNGYFVEDYIKCSAGILRINLQNDLPLPCRCIISGNFTEQLYHLKLWNELISIFAAAPQILVEWTALNATVFIQTCHQLMVLSDDPLSSDLKIKAQKLLMELPTNLHLSIETKSFLGTLLRNSQNVCMQQNDFLEALQWSEKLQLIDDLPEVEYAQDFQLLGHLAKQGNTSESKNLLNILYQKEGSPALWMDFFNILINEAKMSNPLELIENPQSPPGQDKGDFLRQWLKDLPALISQCRKFSNNTNLSLAKQGTYELTHRVFCWCNPNEDLWIEYIKLATTKGTVDIAEKILDLLANTNNIKINLSQQARIISWELVLNSLKLFGSSRFLHPTWWPGVWNEFSNVSKDLKQQLVYSLIKGTANTIHPSHNSKGILLLDKDQLIAQTSGIENAFKILDSDEIAPFVFPKEELFDCSLNINFAKICWYLEKSERKSQALSILRDVFIYLGDDPQTEQRAILLFNTFMQMPPKFNLKKDIHTALVLIQMAQQSSCTIFIDHFNVLRFLKEAALQKFYVVTYNASKKEETNKAIMQSAFLCINDAIKTLLTYTTKNSIVKANEKKLFWWGINTLQSSEFVIGWDLIILCLQPSISIYLEKNEIAKFEDHKNKFKDDLLFFKVIQAYEGVKKCANAVKSPIERWNYLSSQGRIKQFQLQAAEKSALFHATKDICSFFTRILVVMTVVHIIFPFFRK